MLRGFVPVPGKSWFRRGERGIATVFTALIALLATASTAATLTVANGGDFSFDGLTEAVEGSIAKVGGTLEVRGSVIARSDGGETVTTLHIPLRYYGEGPAISFDDLDAERLVMAYHDGDSYVPDLPYTVELLTGNADATFDAGETVLLTLDVSSLELHGNERFTLEVSAPVGGMLIVERRLPPILQPVMSLY